jgi:flagellar capping protein FliD
MSSTSEVTRMSGLVSGLDTESLVKAATANTKNSINSRKQKVQTLQWKQESYRSIITSLQDFQSKYLDITSDTSIRANAVMKSNKAVSSDDTLSVTATASATAANYSITSVQTAKAAKLEGTAASANSVTLDFSGADVGTNTVKVTLDGTTKNISFKGGENARDNFLSALNEAFEPITSAKFTYNGGTELNITNAANDNVTHIFTVGYDSSVGLENDASNRISTTSTLGSLDFKQALDGDEFNITINGTDFSFDSNTTIKSMMNEINKSDAGVKISFNSLSQSFSIETTDTGAGQELEISQSKGNLINSLFNLGTDQIGTSPTVASGLSDKSVDDSVKFSFTADNTGFSSADKIYINGSALTVSGLSKKQDTEKITVDGNELTAKLYSDADGNTIYSYNTDGKTIYAKKGATDDTYDTVMTVTGGTVNVNGQDLEDVSEADELKTLGIEKKYKTYSESDIADALNEAYKAAEPNSTGSFSVKTYDDGVAKITFTPQSGSMVSASASGNITLAATGYESEDGSYSNYSETAYPASTAFSSENQVKFVTADGQNITINGTGDNGSVTLQDLEDSGYFNYDETSGTLSVNGTNVLYPADENTSIAADKLFGTTTLVGTDSNGSIKVYGSNAQMTINGVTLESASNSFTVEGTTFSIGNVKEFTADDVANGDADEITVNVSKDTSKLKETIKNFITEYNNLLDTVHTMLTTSRPKSDDGDYYDPLTEDQEDEMEDDEIEKWNEKAKTGLLYHDSTLTKVFNSLRSVVSGAVTNGMTLQALGIDTSDDYADYGKLEFMTDGESTLDAAIEKYGDEIANFFTDTTTGLGTKLNEAINAAVDTTTSNGYPKGLLTSVAGIENTRSATKNTIYSQISALQTIIENLQDKYESEQEILWSKYSTLETYISNMNNQSQSLFGTSLYGSSSDS